MAKKMVKTVTTTVTESASKKNKNKTMKRKTKPVNPQQNHMKNSEHLSRAITENLIQLQKINLDLAEKFDRLAKEISSLLALFEITAHTFSSHPAIKSSERDREFLDKIDRLLEQNKTIAKGLTMMEGKIKERVYGSPFVPQKEKIEETEKFSQSASTRPLPRF